MPFHSSNLLNCFSISIWKMQVEKGSKSVGLGKEDALNRVRWRVGVGEIAVRVG